MCTLCIAVLRARAHSLLGLLRVGVVQAFVAHYYNVFDTNRQGLAALFQPTSMMTFEGEKFQGPEAIVGKLMKLQFAQCRHVTNIIDAQPTPSGGVLVFCTGNIQVGPDCRLF